MRKILFVFLLIPTMAFSQVAPKITDTVLPNGSIQRTTITTRTTIFTPQQYAEQIKNIQNNVSLGSSALVTMQPILNQAKSAAAESSPVISSSVGTP